MYKRQALEFWKTRVEREDFEDLVIDAERVRNGGKSSKAIMKERKISRSVESKKEIGGEEE